MSGDRSQRERTKVQTKNKKQLYHITLTHDNGMTRRVPVKASSREVAESRALKRNPAATGVKRDG